MAIPTPGTAGQRAFGREDDLTMMTTATSDDLIARVRAYLAGLEPPVRADDLSDEEVAGLALSGLGVLQDWVVRGLLPERFRSPKPPPPPKPKPPSTVEYVHGGWLGRSS